MISDLIFFCFTSIYNIRNIPYILHNISFKLTFHADISSFVCFYALTVYWTMRFMWNCKCQCGSVKCEWSPAEINREFLLIHSRMLFFIEMYTYFSHIPLRPEPYILYRDDDGQIVKQPDFREEPTDSSAAAAGPHPCCGECKQTPRHLTKLSLSSSSLLSSHS